MTPTIVRCGNYTYAATHPDGLCEQCQKPWTVAVYVNGRFLCWTCGTQTAPPPTAGYPPERGAAALLIEKEYRMPDLKRPRSTNEPCVAEGQTDAFLADITALSRKHGIGISGQPILFEMEHDDYERSYRVLPEDEIEFA